MVPRPAAARATRAAQPDLQLMLDLPMPDRVSPPTISGRVCVNCDKSFERNDPGAGTKYCSLACRIEGYARAERTRKSICSKAARGPVFVVCAWCQNATKEVTAGRPTSWPFICAECLSPLSAVLLSLKRHHVDHERARRLLKDPGCEICGVNLLQKVRARVKTSSFTRAMLVVDHDHDCCPGTFSACGRCVRGLICVTCNVALGLLREDPHVVRSAADYLAAWLAR